MWRDGIIATDDGEVIARPHMTPDELRQTRFGTTGKFWTNSESPRHQQLLAPQFRIKNLECEGGAYFLDNELAAFIFLLKRDEAKRLFGSSDLDIDCPEAEYYRVWVKNETGMQPPVAFQWGTVGAGYDSKDMSCHIFFKYEEKRK
jgi:hypothetical protein